LHGDGGVSANLPVEEAPSLDGEGESFGEVELEGIGCSAVEGGRNTVGVLLGNEVDLFMLVRIRVLIGYSWSRWQIIWSGLAL
jgi:hypothetical protein